MKKLLITLATTVALVGPAMACDPARAGDQYEKNGVTYEVVKTNDSCYTKVCVRPVGSKQACRWIKEPENYDVKWSDSRLSASRTTRTSQTSGPISSSSGPMGQRNETRNAGKSGEARELLARSPCSQLEIAREPLEFAAPAARLT